MSARRILLVIMLVLLAPIAGLAGTPGRLWQDGELLSAAHDLFNSHQ